MNLFVTKGIKSLICTAMVVALSTISVTTTIHADGEALVTSEETLIAALADESKSVIKIDADFTTTSPITITRAVTIEGQGHTISTSQTAESGDHSTFTVTTSGVTLQNMVIEAPAKYGVKVYEGASAVLSTIKINTPGFGGVLINGGTATFQSVTVTSADKPAVEFAKGSGVTSVGSIVDGSTITGGLGIYIDAGQITGADLETVKTNAISIAKANGLAVFSSPDKVYYNPNSIVSLIEKAEAGSTVVVQADEAHLPQINIKKNLTIDLNGHTLSFDAYGFVVYGNGNLIFDDTKGNGTVSAEYSAVFSLNGEVLIKNGSYISRTDSALGANGQTSATNWASAIHSKITVENATVSAEEVCLLANGNGAEFVVNGGVFTSANNFVFGNNGTVDEETNYGGTKFVINGGTFNANIRSEGYISAIAYLANKGSITITGGEFNSTKGTGIFARAGKVEISGGEFNVTGALGWVGDKKFNIGNSVIEYDAEAKYPGATPDDHITITGGTFNVTGATTPLKLTGEDNPTKRFTVTGGTYSADVTPFLTADYKANKESDTAYKVTQITATVPTESVKVEAPNQPVQDVVSKAVDSQGHEFTVEVAQGETLALQPEVKAIVDTSNVQVQADVAKLNQTVETLKQATPALQTVAGGLFDIDIVLLKQSNETTTTLGNVTELAKPITLTIPVPEEVPAVPEGKVRTYYLLRVHDGKVEKIAATVSDGKLVFSSDKFSLYQLVYEDVTPVQPTQVAAATNGAVKVTTKSYDDGGPFTKDDCGNVYDRWGNKIWTAPACQVTPTNKAVPNTGVK